MIILSVIWAALIFCILFAFSLGSYCALHRSTIGQQSRNGRSSTILSLCNCFACGIFLSTCFVGLMPHIREQEAKLWILWRTDRATDSSQISRVFMRTEMIVLIGFLLILLVEQVFSACGHHHSSSSRGHACRNAPAGRKSSTVGSKEGDNTTGTVATALLSIDGDEEPLVLDNFDSDDSQGDGANSAPTIEFRRIDDGLEEHHGATAHSGHSHLNVLLASGGRLTFPSCLLLLGLTTHSLFEGIALGVQVNSLDSSSSLLVRFILEGLAAGTFIYVACVEMLSAELHSSNSEHTINRGGIYKALSVIAGVGMFFAITVLFGGHTTLSAATTTAPPTLQSHIRAID
uniref:Zinc transporter ZIP3 n=1 Tax=Parascaris univalens TaxID=6257 RepID=A0A914ZMS7_PARUN